MTFANSLLVAVVGMSVVFFGLVILIMLIKLMGVMTGNMGKKRPRLCLPLWRLLLWLRPPPSASCLLPSLTMRPLLSSRLRSLLSAVKAIPSRSSALCA